ncbi:MAG TPA: glycosyltransferase [bacterium]|nr:glycosyltransferase [bacterium]
MAQELSQLRVALVCDWLTSLGGAAKVEEAILEAFPQADVFTSVCDPQLFDWLKGKKIYTSWLNNVPWLRKKHQLFAWLRPVLFEGFDLSNYDLVISSSSAESKCVITKPETVHICYCHTPIRYYWSDYHEYLNERMEFGILNPLVRWIMPNMAHDLRMTDRLAAERVDYFVANSNYVKRRISKFYRRTAEVIYPPVDLEENVKINREEKEDYFLFVGRLVPYKKADLVVETFLKNGKKLKVVGGGPQLNKLRKMIGDNQLIEVKGEIADQEKKELLAGCRALIFPSREDFGIVPLEAMSYGKPVVAFAEGGAMESVLEGKTGLFFQEQTVDSLNEAIERLEKMNFDCNNIVNRAKQFSRSRFVRELQELVADKMK